MLGRRAQARARQRRAWSTSRRPLAMEDTSGSERAGVGEGACAPLRVGCARGGGGARLITRGEWVRVPGARGARRPVMRGRFGRARPLTCSPYITPKSPERGGPRVGLLWTWNFQSRGLRAPCAPCPRHRRPALHPSGYGTGGGTRSPAVPSLSLDLRSHRRPGGLAGGRRAGAAPVAAAGGAGAQESRGPGLGGGGRRRRGDRGGSRGEGVRGEGRGGAARPAPLPNRKVGLAEVPPPRRAHSAPLRPRASGPGRPPGEPEERTRARREGPETGTPPEPERGRRAEKRRGPVEAGGRPALRARRAGGSAPERPGETKAPAGALPAAARSGRGAGRRRGGAARGAGGGADTL